MSLAYPEVKEGLKNCGDFLYVDISYKIGRDYGSLRDRER